MTDTMLASPLLVLAVIVPVAGVLLSVAMGGPHVERIALRTIPVGLGVAIAIAAEVAHVGPLVYRLGIGHRRSASRCAPTGCRRSCWSSRRSSSAWWR